MASAFNLLTSGGAKFDKNRFKKDIDLFTGNSKASSSKKVKGKGKERATDTDTLPSSLNLFHTSQPKSKAGKNRPEPLSDSESADGSGSDSESDASSSTNIPAPPRQKITITGSEPLPKSLHANLPSLVTDLPSTSGQPLLNALKESNIHSLWGVQCAVGGALLQGRDVMCVAPTGSGKTLAYVLPTLVRLGDPARTLSSSSGEKNGKGKTSAAQEGEADEGKGIRAVIVVPTHDLAVQIEGVVKAVTRKRGWRVIVLSKATEKAVCESAPGSGVVEKASEEGSEDENEEDDQEEAKEDNKNTNGDEQSGSLGIDILISTPERLHHLIQEGKVSLSKTRHIILDESDRLLSSDFIPQITPILSACTFTQVQKCFLSATMPAGPEAIAGKWLRDGVRVVVGLKDSAVSTITQSLLYTASESGKTLALQNLINHGDLPYPSLIFTQSIERADELHKYLSLEGLRVGLVHGQITPKRRDEAVEGFRKGDIWVLVVTEVLARGMDFRGVKVVVNYDFPQTVQSYIHRIGRTGRAGRPGKAITFFSNEDAPYLKTIANVLTASGCAVPSYMLNLPNPSKNTKKNLAKAPPKRKAVGGGGRDVGKEEGRRLRGMVEGSQRKRGKVDMDE